MMTTKPKRLSIGAIVQARGVELCFIIIVILALYTFVISLVLYQLGCSGEGLINDDSSIKWIQDHNLRAYFGRRRIPVYRVIQVKPEKDWEEKYFDIYDISTEDISKEAQFYMDAFHALQAKVNSSDYYFLDGMTNKDRNFIDMYQNVFKYVNLSTGNLVTHFDWSSTQNESIFYKIDWSTENSEALSGVSEISMQQLR